MFVLKHISFLYVVLATDPVDEAQRISLPRLRASSSTDSLVELEKNLPPSPQSSVPTATSYPDFGNFFTTMRWIKDQEAMRSETPMGFSSGEPFARNESPFAGRFSPVGYSQDIDPPPSDGFAVKNVMNIYTLIGGRGNATIDSCLEKVVRIIEKANVTPNNVFDSDKEIAALLNCLTNTLDGKIFNLDSSGPVRESAPPASPSLEGTTRSFRFVVVILGNTVNESIQLARMKWFFISRRLRQLVKTAILGKDKVFETAFWPATLSTRPSTFVPSDVWRLLRGLSAYYEEFKVTEWPGDWTLYSGDYYLSGGPRLLGQIRILEQEIADYIEGMVVEYSLPLLGKQLEAASYLTNLVNAPAMNIASWLPASDVDPLPVSFLRSGKQKLSLSEREVLDLLQAARYVWPPTEYEKGFGVECLVLRFIALSRLSEAEAENSDISVTNQHLIPESMIPGLSLVRHDFDKCLARVRHTDMVSLPMMLYHLLAKVRAGFDYKTLGPLIDLFESNFNWIELDRAAKVRAATAIEKPNWWATWNCLRTNSLPKIKDFLPQIGTTGNADFDNLVGISLSSREVVKLFNAIDFDTLPVRENPSVRAAVAILRMIVLSIRATGDFRVMNQWNFVISKPVSEYEAIIAKSTVDIAQVGELVNRMRALQKVAHFHPRETSEEEDKKLAQDLEAVLDELFELDLNLEPSKMSTFFLHFIRNAKFDAYLAHLALERFILNLKTKAGRDYIEQIQTFV